MNIQEIVSSQRDYFTSGLTRPVKQRRLALLKLKHAIIANEDLIYQAMKADMNKCQYEVYMTEIGLVLDDIGYALKHLDSWAKPKRVKTPISQFKSTSFILPKPYGVTLIMSPWNYPIQLCFAPLVGALAAGCTAVLKPASYAPETSHVIAKIIEEAFPPDYVAVVEGGRSENKELLEQDFDYIFFTGSPAVGKQVMEAAAKHLTPVTLELGGKSPVIVDQTAKIPLAARRIAFGKVLNAGQTCVEPDYLLIHESVKDDFIQAYKKALQEFFPDGDYKDMNVIINEKHFQRLCHLLDSGTAVVGGNVDASRRFVEPTLLDEVSPESPIMQEEIFGPILPMLTFQEIDECIDFIEARPHPLALYVFTEDKAVERRVLSECRFGGSCVNDTIVHLATPHLPFGGVGSSGMGSYHGKESFSTFTHYTSVLKKSTWIDLPVRYRPYTDWKDKLLRNLLK